VGFLLCFEYADWSVVVDDDDRTVHAYLRHGTEIVGDVWLCNRGPAPVTDPWRQTGARPPFMNPARYVSGDGLLPDLTQQGLTVSWPNDVGDDFEVSVSVNSKEVGWLRPRAKPGWAAMARLSGPLALAR
jgi:hypothetical protein